MGFKSVINDLVKTLRVMVFINMLVLTIVIPFVLSGIGIESSRVALLTAFAGFILCAANFFFISGYFTRKTESTLNTSYATIAQEYLYDELTRVYNRRAGIMRLNEEFARAKRSGSTLSIAMADADFFKKINDTYGHIAGDKILTHIATTIKSGLRECDVVVRYGGEEFLILLPDTSDRAAARPLDRLRAELAKKPYMYNGQEIPVSISIGIASISDSDEDPSEIIYRADNALYSAKKSGRNKVVYGRQKHALRPAMSHA